MYNKYDLTFEKDQTGKIKEAYKRIKKNIKKKKEPSKEDTNMLLNFLKEESKVKQETYQEKQENARSTHDNAIKENMVNNMSTKDMNNITAKATISMNISQNMQTIYDCLSQDITLVKNEVTNTNMKRLLEEYRLIKNYENDYAPYATTDTTLPVKMHDAIDELPKRIIKNCLTEKRYQ